MSEERGTVRAVYPAMRIALLTLVFVSLALNAFSAAPPRDSAPQLVSTGPKWKNVEQLRRFAAQGDPQACFELGDRLLNGDGLATDPRAAREWLEKAARGGMADAMFRLGKLHYDGIGGPKDIEQALDYYTQAARLRVPEALHNIGAILVSGRGVKRDYAEGLAWLLVAEKNGAVSDAVARTRERLAKRPADIAAAEARAAELIEALGDPAKREKVAPHFTVAGAPPAKPAPATEPKREGPPPKVKIDLDSVITPPAPTVTPPKGG